MKPILNVARWPTYLLRNVPENLRSAIAVEAEECDESIADVIRYVLCGRYKLHCPPASFHYNHNGGSSETILLRLQPHLLRRLRIEAKDTHTTMRAVILKELDREFGG